MGARVTIDDAGLAARHARTLLDLLGDQTPVAVTADHPAVAWRRVGLMHVTGRHDGPGLVAPVPIASAANGALAALAAIAPSAILPTKGALLLGERARLLGLGRHGRISPNQSCRLVAASDGRVALNLPRADDWESMPALLGRPAADWPAVERAAARLTVEEMVSQGRLMGLAIAADRAVPPRAPFSLALGAERSRRRGTPLVIDLSALWAGPLAGALLRDCGARVVKVESVRRPDGARAGGEGFFALLNGGKASVALDFADENDRAALRHLVGRADIVIEGSRPRALRELGIDAERLAADGTIWVSITGHGRTGAAADWVGFGDDAAVAGGLSAAMASGWGEPLFAGDAIADPLTGITAALAAWSLWCQGRGGLVAIALADVIAHACGLGEVGDVLSDWTWLAQTDAAPIYPLRTPPFPAPALGADTHAVLAT